MWKKAAKKLESIEYRIRKQMSWQDINGEKIVKVSLEVEEIIGDNVQSRKLTFSGVESKRKLIDDGEELQTFSNIWDRYSRMLIALGNRLNALCKAGLVAKNCETLAKWCKTFEELK
ncbi:unnamed protein product [Caenorhabditis bovis]|uniref:Uncharacterized protein n=1 Tax=Caenorhabditis bovis TaxID=2654633 RepID=A0A8S1F2E7_9PELO|nr:unnamed protein product [Caenorhabditis bovis]